MSLRPATTRTVANTKTGGGAGTGHPADRALGAVPPALLRAIDPRVRLVASVAFALVVISMSQLPALLVALALAALTAVAARAEPGMTLRRLAALDGFMVFVLLLLPFSVPGAPLFTVAGFPASDHGLVRAAEILLKSNAVALMMLALLGALEPVELGHAMARLRLPEKFVTLFLFTVRSIDVLGGEYRRLRTAMTARGFTMRCNLHTWRSVGYLFGMLLVQSLERSERIVAAMRCRGFDGRFPSLAPPARLRGPDHLFALASLAGMAVLITVEGL